MSISKVKELALNKLIAEEKSYRSAANALEVEMNILIKYLKKENIYNKHPFLAEGEKRKSEGGAKYRVYKNYS